MEANDSQVPWTDEQWARVNQVIQEEASRARVGATFLPFHGPLPGTRTSCEGKLFPFLKTFDPRPPQQIAIADRDTMQLATLQVRVPVRGAQMADPEMRSVLAYFGAPRTCSRVSKTLWCSGDWL